jgi:hypothetical protein
MSVSKFKIEVEYCPDGQGTVVKDMLFDKTVGFPKVIITINDAEPLVIETCLSTILAVRDPENRNRPHDLKKILNQKFEETKSDIPQQRPEPKLT